MVALKVPAPTAAAGRAVDDIPVSYTHLDVYKRQVNSRVMTLDGVLAVLQKKLAAAGLVNDSIVKEISFEYMSVEDPETYNSTVFPCWRFCIACLLYTSYGNIT